MEGISAVNVEGWGKWRSFTCLSHTLPASTGDRTAFVPSGTKFPSLRRPPPHWSYEAIWAGCFFTYLYIYIIVRIFVPPLVFNNNDTNWSMAQSRVYVSTWDALGVRCHLEYWYEHSFPVYSHWWWQSELLMKNSVALVNCHHDRNEVEDGVGGGLFTFMRLNQNVCRKTEIAFF